MNDKLIISYANYGETYTVELHKDSNIFVVAAALYGLLVSAGFSMGSIDKVIYSDEDM